MPSIRIESGSDKGVICPIRSEWVSLGRSSRNDVVIRDDAVSSSHAVIAYLNQCHFIEDSESANGTFVNGVRVQRKRLKNGDEILVGKTRLRYFDSSVPEEETDEHVPIRRRDSREIVNAFSARTPLPKDNLTLRRAHENLKRVYEIHNIITSIFSIKELAEKILDIIFPLFDADRGYIMLAKAENAELDLIASRKRETDPGDSTDVAFSETIARRVLEKEESVITSNAPEDKRFARKQSILGGQIKSAMCVPIRGRDEKLGVIYVDHRGASGHFSDEGLQLLTMVANSTGIAIENIRLYEENLKMNVLKAVNEEMRETNRKLLELESLKEDLINMVVHDMKNPVSNTMMGLDMIAFDSEGEMSDQQKDYLQMAKRNQFKLSEMITNLLEISKLESDGLQINKASLEVPDLINRIIERYSATIKKEEKTVTVSDDPAVRRIVSDERLLERILSNILSNAIKHSHPNGEIFVEVVPAEEPDSVAFSIKDFGVGIPKEYHEKIFEKFCQAGLREIGHRTDTGLGLAFCKMAVGALGGRIWVDSMPGKGSRFTFVLPGALATERQ